jgi:hypothetical protein
MKDVVDNIPFQPRHRRSPPALPLTVRVHEKLQPPLFSRWIWVAFNFICTGYAVRMLIAVSSGRIVFLTFHSTDIPFAAFGNQKFLKERNLQNS